MTTALPSAMPLPRGRVVTTGDEAVAYAVVLARAQAFGCYPITPQTIIVERLADLAVGRDDVELANLESEHAMFGWVIAAARAGVRTFTATSSQGLLYAHEQLHRASRERVPLVAVDVNRAVFAPWSIQPDLSDSMSQRDTGWIQLYCASAQEAFDTVLCAYRIAERVLLPVMVCAEGFLLSHTSEAIEIPEQRIVDAFLPPLDLPADLLLDPARARTFSALPEPAGYAAFQQHVAQAMDEAAVVVDEAAAELSRLTGRPKAGTIEVAGDPDADTALVTIGTIGDTALELLGDEATGGVRLIRVHCYRPFPAAQLTRALAGATTVAVVDRAPAFGALGPLGGDVLALDIPGVRGATNVIAGLGGVDVTPATLRWAIAQARSGAGRGPLHAPPEAAR